MNMKIGILTFYRVANFGANLQAVSTYFNVEKRGHEPWLIYYEPPVRKSPLDASNGKQAQMHREFLDGLSLRETEVCRDSHDIMTAVGRHGIDAIIVGSDAVVQHHPLLSRIRKGRRKPFWVVKKMPDKSFPNPFWGAGIDVSVPMAMMSVSSQNSQYNLFSTQLRQRMMAALSRMRYISVRDNWTKQMMLSVVGNARDIPVTPDPVFAFNLNAPELIPSEGDIRKRFRLPENYVLVCLYGQNLEYIQLREMEEKFCARGRHCVAFCLPIGIKFKHPFKYEVDTPLSPLDWYAIIKNASGYIGCNMHPIVVSLHNAVPCFSIDHWGTRNFWGRSSDNGSSKVADILDRYGLKANRGAIENGACMIDTDIIIDKICNFPQKSVAEFSRTWADAYQTMMDDILISLQQ